MNLNKLHIKLKEKGIIDCTYHYLYKLVAQGYIPYTEVNGKKDFDYKEARDAVVEHMENPISNNVKKSPPKPVRSRAKKKPKTLVEARIELTTHQAELAKKKVEIEDSKYILREEVEKQAFSTVRIIRDQILTIPERLSGEIASITDITTIKEMLYKEINEVLNGLTERSLYEKK